MYGKKIKNFANVVFLPKNRQICLLKRCDNIFYHLMDICSYFVNYTQKWFHTFDLLICWFIIFHRGWQIQTQPIMEIQKQMTCLNRIWRISWMMDKTWQMFTILCRVGPRTRSWHPHTREHPLVTLEHNLVSLALILCLLVCLLFNSFLFWDFMNNSFWFFSFTYFLVQMYVSYFNYFSDITKDKCWLLCYILGNSLNWILIWISWICVNHLRINM